MNTYRAVTQVIEKAKKELLRCHPGSSFRKRSWASVPGDRDDFWMITV